MTESVTLRIFIIFLCVNMALVFAGFSIDDPKADVMDAEYDSSGVADSSGISGFMTMVQPLIDLICGGGIMGLLVAAGMPTELQLLVGLPFSIMGVILLLSLVKSLIPLLR